LFSNLLGILPVFTSPTGQVSVPLACAILTFLYFNWQGIKHHGPVGYLKHFAGPVPWLSPLIFPVEIISTSARIVSLTVRLWANIFCQRPPLQYFRGLFTSATLAVWPKAPFWAVLWQFSHDDSYRVHRTASFGFRHSGLHFTVLPSVYLGMATADEH